METATAAEDKTAPDLGRILEVTAQILAPITALTAVLYYFGYVRYQAFFGYFGATWRAPASRAAASCWAAPASRSGRWSWC